MNYNENELAEFFEYLDDLRESGVTNMYGADAYLRDEFGMSLDDSRDVLSSWMDTFDPDCSTKARAEIAFAVK